MDNIEKYRDFVKEQAAFHLRMANKYATDVRRRDLHARTSETFNEIYEFLDHRVQENVAERQKLTLGWEEISDLPPELVAELSVSDADKTEFNVLSVVGDSGGVTSLDRLLVGYYRLTGEVMKRAQMTNRIYRMIQKGMLFSVPGRKGVYSMKEMTEAEAAALI